MGERKGTNKYYPPDFDYKKHKSLAGYTGAHPLRERARKLHQGILIIRFELPYNIWCGGCNSHVGMGVRYNAEKSKIGMYYTTPIYKFRMKCHLCDNHFEIKTDPANHDYVIIQGARRKEQRWDPKENEQIVPEDKATQKKLAQDPMYKLEHGAGDQTKAKDIKNSVSLVASIQERHKDDFMLNKLARDMFRKEKTELKKGEDEDKRLLEKGSLDIKLVPEDERDVKIAGLLRYNVTQSFDEKQEDKRRQIESQSIFSTSPETNPIIKPSPSRDHSADNIQRMKSRIAESAKQSKTSNFLTKNSEKKDSLSLGIVRKRKSTDIVKDFGQAKKSVVPMELTSVVSSPTSKTSETVTIPCSTSQKTNNLLQNDASFSYKMPISNDNSAPQTLVFTNGSSTSAAHELNAYKTRPHIYSAPQDVRENETSIAKSQSLQQNDKRTPQNELTVNNTPKEELKVKSTPQNDVCASSNALLSVMDYSSSDSEES